MGQGSDSRLVAEIVQLVERHPHKVEVAGSNPALGIVAETEVAEVLACEASY